MTLGRRFSALSFACLCVLSGCSGGGGSGGGSENLIETAIQDLDLDPEGLTTAIAFLNPVAGAQVANFACDGGQVPQGVVAVAGGYAVTWDDRVTPSHKVRAVGLEGVSAAWAAVATSDPSAPTFTLPTAQQNTGLGGDEISVEFAGPHVVPAEAEDPASWKLVVGGKTLDLTGSTLSLDVPTQVLTITTGTMANLHASFELTATSLHSVADVSLAATAVAGTATGDSTPPSLVSLVQNLAEDELGRVVDVTFDEAMDPVFATVLANFLGTTPDLSTSVEQPSPEVLRVSFNNPMVPGIDSIQLENLVDAHGNAFPSTLSAIAQGSTVANDFDGDPEATTVANLGGDYVLAQFVQALDPDSALDPARWSLESPAGTPVDLSNATFTYDLAAKELLIELDVDLASGASFAFAPAAGNAPWDVDGEDFASSFAGNVGGDTTPPSVLAMIQNRTVDPSGKTVDATLSEDVDEASAENPANWSVSGVNVLTATRMAGLDLVRLALDDLAVPGASLGAAANVADLAGNVMGAQNAIPVGSTDITPPSPITAAASAVEGADNDTVVVAFDDDMIEADVTNPAWWVVESPVGTMLGTNLAGVTWEPIARTATLTFAAGTAVDLKRGDDFRVRFVNMRDIGGNPVTSTALTGGVVAESNLPQIVSVWVESAFANRVHVRFSEPCDWLDDLGGWTIYTVRDSGGVIKGTPSSATEDADRMGVRLTFGFAVIASSDTLDVYGITDLAGNVLFPLLSAPIAAEDSAEPGLSGGASLATTLTGEENDALAVTFDRQPSPWGLLDSDHWSLTQGGNPVDLAVARFVYDGSLGVTIQLDGMGAASLTTGELYELRVFDLLSAQGVAMSGPSSDMALAAGDTTPPDLPAGRARIDAANPTDSILIEMDEAIDPADAVDVTKIDINGATNPDTATRLCPRTIRATFGGGVTTADTVNVNLRDLAGNAGIASRAIVSQDVSGPLVTGVSGVSVSGLGGDYVIVNYDKPVELQSGLLVSNYAVTNGATAINLAGAQARYASGLSRVTIYLPPGQELQPSAGLTVEVDGVNNHAGLAMNPPASIGGTVGGDTTAPSLAAAFANHREDAAGRVIDLRFGEHVEEAFALAPANWTASGGQGVVGVEALDLDLYRLTLTAALASGQTLSITGIRDLAGNAAGLLQIAPLP
jgi:hypothetical protein